MEQAKAVPITERLRNIKIGSYTVDHGSHTKHIAVRAICEEAAAEIERLKTQSESLARSVMSDHVSNDSHSLFIAAIRDLAAINEHLDLDPDDGGAVPIIGAIDELRAALVSARDAQQLILTCKHGEFCEHYSVAEKAVKASLTGIDALLSGQPVEDPRDAKIASLQAKIDALMLEYCPDEITLEQMEEWASHQVVCEDPRDKVIEAANNLYKAVQAFRNDDYLGRCHGLRRTQTYSALCDAWDEMREQFEALAAIEQLKGKEKS